MPKLAHTIYLTVIAGLSATVIGLGYYAPKDTVQETEARPTITSIAVLPFHVRGSEDSAKQIAETIRSGLINGLSNEPHLKVASRGDTRVFADTTLSIRDIGDKLSVSTILEGAVQEMQDRVRVTVQLIDVGTDEHVWSQVYERDIDDLDSIVADVERSIATLARD